MQLFFYAKGQCLDTLGNTRIDQSKPTGCILDRIPVASIAMQLQLRYVANTDEGKNL